MTYQELFIKAKEKGFKKIQVTEKENTGSSVQIINGEINSYEDYNNISYDIKAEKNKKTVKLSTNYLEDEIINLLELKYESTDSSYEDEYLEKTKNINKIPISKVDISNEVKILKDMENLRKKYKEIDKLDTCLDEEYSNIRIINSDGVDISTDSHLIEYIVQAIVTNNDEVTSIDKSLLTTNKEDIDFYSFTEDVIKKTIIQSKRKKLNTKRYNLILDNDVASNIMSHLIDMLSATNIRNKVSCLEDKIEKKVFSDLVTIIEDPTNKKYPGYRLFDNEGTKTYKKPIVEKGIIKTYLYDIKEAKIKDTKSTANSYSGISTRNMFLKRGEKDVAALLKELDSGIYITDYMGAQGTSINTVNGQISLQIFGFIVKDGKIVSGFEPAIMTTTIFELFSNIKEVGSDLRFTNTSTASPSILIKDISIAS